MTRLAVIAAVLIAQPALLERTLALVGGQSITLGDVRAAIAFGLAGAAAAGSDNRVITGRLVDRELMLREVQRYAPPAPAESVVEARVEEIRRRFANPAAFGLALDRHGFTEIRLRAWIRDDLRTDGYLTQRFASASTPTDAEVSAAYTRARVEFDRAGISFDQAGPLVRERLTIARRADLINDWLSDLRRRTDVIILDP